MFRTFQYTFGTNYHGKRKTQEETAAESSKRHKGNSTHGSDTAAMIIGSPDKTPHGSNIFFKTYILLTWHTITPSWTYQLSFWIFFTKYTFLFVPLNTFLLLLIHFLPPLLLMHSSLFHSYQLPSTSFFPINLYKHFQSFHFRYF